eukprot:11799_1
MSSEPCPTKICPNPQPTDQSIPQPTDLPIPQPTDQMMPQPNGRIMQQENNQVMPQPASEVMSGPTGQMMSEPTCQMLSQPTGQMMSPQNCQMMSQPSGLVMSQPTGQMMSQPTGQMMSQPTGQLIPQMVSQMNAERSEYCDFEKKVRALPSELPRVDAVDNLPLSNLNCRNFQRYRGPLEPSNPASRRCSRPKAGRVKWFNARRGFGYIVVDQPPEEVYVHAVDVLKAPQI